MTTRLCWSPWCNGAGEAGDNEWIGKSSDGRASSETCCWLRRKYTRGAFARSLRALAAASLLCCTLRPGGTPAAVAHPVSRLRPLPSFQFRSDPLTIVQPVEPEKPFTVAGEQGAVLGRQDGSFEAWLFPTKVLSRFRLTAEIADYPVPIDLAAHAATIEVSPAMTTITYSHAAFTVKQRMFATRPGVGLDVVVLFEISAVRPMDLTFRFKADLLRMWPASNFGIPNPVWVPDEDGGYYILHTDNPDLKAVVAMPHTHPGILPPYGERPKIYPVEFKLHFDPKTDSNLLFPLLILEPGSQPVTGSRLSSLIDGIPRMYAEVEEYYRHFFDARLTAETPDSRLDRALRWAEISIDKGRVRFHDETGLVAGYFESGDSARPGFAWFFGRDALWTSYAVNSYGDFAFTRQIMQFLMRRQRADGKIMHEFSQTADLVNWASFPYFYASADSTPLFVMSMEDYVDTSGDVGFLRTHWDAVKRAYEFTRAHDSDGDGIYDNSQGTGWVESWPPGMPHQELYLAALDQQSAEAMSRLAALMEDNSLARAATAKAEEIRGKLRTEYYNPDTRIYAFSRNADGTRDSTATMFPAVAWWTGRLSLADADAMLDRWASAEFSTDWGTRDLSDHTPFYDPISYHQGSVWPLFTGWVSLAEYRTGRALSGYSHLMQNADLTWAQDPGTVTELLSGQFFQPLGRSTSHQIWSSAMVLAPALRGLFGLDWDALHHTLRLAPNLPATWSHAVLHNVPIGGSRVDLEYDRKRDSLLVRALSARPESLCLVAQDAPQARNCDAPAETIRELKLPLPAVEVELPEGLPLPGSETAGLKVISERRTPSGMEVEFEAPGSAVYRLAVRLNKPHVSVKGGELTGDHLNIRMPAGQGYQHLLVTFAW